MSSSPPSPVQLHSQSCSPERYASSTECNPSFVQSPAVCSHLHGKKRSRAETDPENETLSTKSEISYVENEDLRSASVRQCVTFSLPIETKKKPSHKKATSQFEDDRSGHPAESSRHCSVAASYAKQARTAWITGGKTSNALNNEVEKGEVKRSPSVSISGSVKTRTLPYAATAVTTASSEIQERVLATGIKASIQVNDKSIQINDKCTLHGSQVTDEKFVSRAVEEQSPGNSKSSGNSKKMHSEPDMRQVSTTPRNLLTVLSLKDHTALGHTRRRIGYKWTRTVSYFGTVMSDRPIQQYKGRQVPNSLCKHAC